jgi:hypothetical protein
MKLKDQVFRHKKLKKIERSSFVEDFYESKKEVNDKRFGKISIWTKTTGDDLLLMKIAKSYNLKKCKVDIEQASGRLKLNHNYILHMVDYAVKQPKPKNFEVWSFYQAPLQDLKKEIQRRKKLKK